MSLDQNLFTLLFTPNQDDPTVTDLVDPSGTTHYRKRRVPGPTYAAEVYDPISESLLIKVSAPSATSKHKTLELCNPTQIVELKFIGTLSFKWGFSWGEHDFEWKREECFLIRKPDPPVLVAVTKEPAGKLKTTSVQILDYNINRFDIDDRKGLEIVLLTALLTFQDSNSTYHTPQAPSRSGSSDSPAITSSSIINALRRSPSSSGGPPPIPPPKPAPKTGIARLRELQTFTGVYNEVQVEEEGNIEDYGAFCAELLSDEALLFVTLRSSSAEVVPKLLLVVEETKRIRHKAGLSEEKELHQYVLFDTPAPPKGPRRIVLDDNNSKDKAHADYVPPSSVTVHLSKIPMPELQPRAVSSAMLTDTKKGKEKEKEDKKKGKEREKEDKKKDKEDKKKGKEKEDKKKDKSKDDKDYKKDSVDKSKKHKDVKDKRGSSSSPPPVNKLTRPPPPQSKSYSRVHSHQTHPYQPTPSPSQINNPAIYAAPPPPSNNHHRLSTFSNSWGAWGSPSVPSPPQQQVSGYYGSHMPTPPPPPPPPPPQQQNRIVTPSDMMASLIGSLRGR